MSDITEQALPLVVAGVAIAIILMTQPISGDIAGLPGNLFAAGIVALGGILGTIQ